MNIKADLTARDSQLFEKTEKECGDERGSRRPCAKMTQTK